MTFFHSNKNSISQKIDDDKTSNWYEFAILNHLYQNLISIGCHFDFLGHIFNLNLKLGINPLLMMPSWFDEKRCELKVEINVNILSLDIALDFVVNKTEGVHSICCQVLPYNAHGSCY